MDLAYEENLQIMAWTRVEGKRKEIKEVFKSLKERIDLAVKEIKKISNCKILILKNSPIYKYLK